MSAASDASATAAAAAERLREAASELSDAGRASDRVAALTETIRAYEDGLGALRDALREAALRERAIRQKLDAESTRLSGVLAALQTIGRSPELAVLLHPDGALDTVHAAMLMSDVVPALDSEVRSLKAELEELRVLALLRQNAAGTLQNGLDGVQAARTELSRAISERTGLPEANATDEAALQALLNSADTLDAFAASLAEARVTDNGSPGFESERGRLPLPVAGTVLAGFDESDAAGIRRPGLVMATAPRALVTAPWPATVRYAGPLLDYGNVMILEPEDGYLVVLAGLSEVFRVLGEVVGQGEALGLMGGRVPDAGEILEEASDRGGQEGTETLYIEVRAGDEPVDPADWFALGRE